MPLRTPAEQADFVHATLDMLDDSATALAQVLRRCIRIAHVRGDWRALTWLELEASEFGGPRVGDEGLSADLLRELGRDPQDRERALIVDEYIRRRQMSRDEDLISAHSVEQLEWLDQMFKEEVAANAPQANDDFRVANDKAQARMKLRETAQGNRAILAKSRTALMTFLLRLERELGFSDQNQDVFERTRAYVDAHLSSLSDEAVERFVGAFSRLRDGDAESLSQAVTSCRRVLHSLADAVCPPQGRRTGTDGRTRDLTADKYRNRLLWFLVEDVPKTSIRPLLQSDVAVISDRLEALDGLSGKGVHAAVSAQEAEALALHIYLLAAEVLRLKDEGTQEAREA